jgi:hypothetical protein
MRSPQFTIAFAAALALTASATAAETAKYRLDIDVTWSAETHPYDFFPNAHLTRLIGATHNSRYVLFGDGRTASSGLQSVAERGHTEIISAELEDAKERERLDGIFEAEGFGVPAKISVTFAANEEHGFVSFATMIAPSPDWFTGVADVRLLENGAWVAEKTLDLEAWDAGTDSGATFTSSDADTMPREAVRLLDTEHFAIDGKIVPVGTVTFKRL